MPRFTLKIPRGVRKLFRLPPTRDRLLHDMDDEVAAHLTMRADELRAAGMSEADAEAEALRRFGDSQAFRSHVEHRAARRAQRLAVARWGEELAQDIRAAMRQLRHAPTLSGVVVLTLGLSIGAMTAVYGVVHHLLLAPLPYPDGNRIVSLEMRKGGDGTFRWTVDASLYRLWATRSRTLEEFAAYDWQHWPVGGPSVDTVPVASVTPSFLPMLRVRPSLGRGFSDDDARRGAPAVAILSDSLWQAQFGGDPRVIGKSILVNGQARAIVGVLPRRVEPPAEREPTPAVWLPLDIEGHDVQAFARLRPGVTSATASRELDAIRRMLPDTGSLKDRRGEARTAADRVEPQQRDAVELLFVAAGGLLLIACADVAGLLLMRGWARRREFAVRQVLGAGRGRLARMLLTECLLLAIPAGVLGVLVAWLGLRPAALGYFADVRVDARVLAWSAALSIVTVMLFGIGPALVAGERSLDGALRSNGSGSGASRASGRAHVGLIVGQIALSLMFLAAAGVLARSFVALVRAPIGFEPKGLIEVTVKRAPPSPGQKARRFTTTERAAAVHTLYQTLAATPGVREVAVGALPLTNIIPGPNAVESPQGIRSVEFATTAGAEVSPDYFWVTRIQLARGRGFSANPSAAGGEVVINDRLARLLWPDRDPLGARLHLGGNGDLGEWRTVVGIANDVRMPGGRAADFYQFQMYLSPSDDEPSAGSFVLRARGDPAALRPALVAAIERAGVGATLRNVTTAEAQLEYAYRGPRVAMFILGAFAMLGLVLTAVGLFGIVAFAVARRTREIGIRVALGADPASLIRSVLGQSLKLAAIGCMIGLAGAYGSARGLSSLVYDVRPTDPMSIGGAIGLMTIVAVAAAAFPVRQALSVDPAETLRSE
jgi:putative ABC transport system permease protein